MRLHQIMILVVHEMKAGDLNDNDRGITIARGDIGPLDGRNHAYELCFFVSREHRITGLFGLECNGRSWLGARWSTWDRNKGWLGGPAFDLADLEATDWRFA